MNKQKISTILLIFGLLLAACNAGSSAEPTATQLEAQAVYTAAARTAEAKMTLNAALSPTPLPATPTATPAPTQPVTPTLSLSPTATQAAGGVQTGVDLITFVADLTVPDGTTYAPGETFVKTWRLQNNGSTTWNTSYSLVFISGSQMNGPASVPLTASVAPGATLDVSVSLTAPAQAGAHTGNWMLRNANGKNFGLGPIADTPFYVQINVGGNTTPGTAAATTTGTPAGTPAATPSLTPTVASSGSVVRDASISVDVASYEGACPHTFNFVAEFTLNQAATVTYQLEAETGFSITLPPATTAALGAGKQTVDYSLEFTNSFTGWARLRVTAPESVLSNQVNLKLTCE